MRTAQRIQAICASKTTELTAVMDKMRRAGRSVINLAIGEPDYTPPEAVIAATRSALEQGETRYGPVAGIGGLRESLATEFDGCRAENILITNGAKQALYSVFQVLCDPGDEIIIPSPCWVSFPEQVKLAGGRPILVPTRRHQLDIDGIRQVLSPRTRAVLINSPNNPTGAVYPRTDVASVVRLCRRNNVFLISDEAYHVFVHDGLKPFSARQVAGPWDAIIVVRSFSKQYHMTGFRVGYVAAAASVVQALTRLQSHLTGNVCTFAQYGALQAHHLDSDQLGKQLEELRQNRDAAFEALSGICDCVKPQGALYLFPDVSGRLKKNQSTLDFATELLERTGVAVVPGEAFGTPGSIRISYGVRPDVLREGLRKLAEAL